MLKYSRPSKYEILMLRGIANFQFGYPSGHYLIPDNIIVTRSVTTYRIRNILINNKVVLTLRPSDGLFSLHIEGGKILLNIFRKPRHRIIVPTFFREDIIKTRTVFCKHVLDVDPESRQEMK